MLVVLSTTKGALNWLPDDQNLQRDMHTHAQYTLLLIKMAEDNLPRGFQSADPSLTALCWWPTGRGAAGQHGHVDAALCWPLW